LVLLNVASLKSRRGGSYGGAAGLIARILDGLAFFTAVPLIDARVTNERLSDPGILALARMRVSYACR
jgi:hypothetical protein